MNTLSFFNQPQNYYFFFGKELGGAHKMQVKNFFLVKVSENEAISNFFATRSLQIPQKSMPHLKKNV